MNTITFRSLAALDQKLDSDVDVGGFQLGEDYAVAVSGLAYNLCATLGYEAIGFGGWPMPKLRLV